MTDLRFWPTSPRRRQRPSRCGRYHTRAVPPGPRQPTDGAQSGNSPLSACGDRSVAVSGPMTSPVSLKNSDYSAAVSAVRIPLSPPSKWLILLIYWSLRPDRKSSRLSAALRGATGRCGQERRLSDRRCVANRAIISVGDCCSTVWESVVAGNVSAGFAAWQHPAQKNGRRAQAAYEVNAQPKTIRRTRACGAAPAKSAAGGNGRGAFGR